MNTLRLFEFVKTPDCEYGDKSSGCEGIHSSTCYIGNNADSCCNTCQDFQTDIPGNAFWLI